MPDVTKNTGMSSPKARPVSFASSCWSPPQAALDAARSQPRTHRARCPSRTGWPRSTAARAEARSAVRWSGRWLRTGPDQGRSREVSRRSRADGSVVSTAISADRQHDQRPARDCGCSAGLPWRAPGRAPPAPWFMIASLNRVPSWPLSWRIVSRAPRAVDVSAIATGTSAFTARLSPMSHTIAKASPTQISQVTIARPPPRAVSSFSSTS
jgi:hypothetical protein